MNTVIQGTAADIIKLAMVRCHASAARGRPSTSLILTIHDELLFEAPPEHIDAARELIEREMVGVWDHSPPLAVDIGVGPTCWRPSDGWRATHRTVIDGLPSRPGCPPRVGRSRP